MHSRRISASVDWSKNYQRAIDFNIHNVTSRYMEKFGVSQEIAELHERECKRYLFLCSKFRGEGLGMRGPVDDYWHTFLLFTKEYQSFCKGVAGFFIHHVPNVGKSKDNSPNSFFRTMDKYLDTFGENPDSRAWPDYRAAQNADCDPCGEVGCKNDPAPGAPECGADSCSDEDN